MVMERYPKTLMEFETQFRTEKDCRDYLFQIRWPNGYICPRCGGVKSWRIRNVLFQCSQCDHQASLTTGTVFQDTHLSLRVWFRAIWLVTSQKNGASALGLKRVLGCSYKTAWMLLHKLRRAMVRPGRDRLTGKIEVDETYFGSAEEGFPGRKIIHKALIAIAVQEDGKGIGRIRMKRISDVTTKSLHPFIEEVVEPGSTVHTDGWDGYSGLGSKGYRHQVTVLAQRKQSPSDLLPRVHRVVSLLKRWLLGTHQGAISHQHLDTYLNEFMFRFNRRTSHYRGKLFYRLIQQALQIPPAPYMEIARHTRGRRPRKHSQK